jgi:Flp pilus assembly protein CpaB
MGDVLRLRRPRSPVHLLRQVAAGVLACLALVLALRPPSPATGPPAVAAVPVVVAAADLPTGTVLSRTDVATVALPAELAPAGAATTTEELTGQVLAAPVRAGEPVTDVRVVGPRLWSQVPDGLVAAPVRLADLAVATLLRAGDRVDVLATASLDGSTPTATVVAEDALVLTVPTTDPAQGAVGSGDGLLVLAVPPATARELAAAGAAATLTVTLGRP